MAVTKNPLLSPQREKAGAETAADYAYQYHWALYRAIQEHGDKNEYAIFMELHEDVVICDSLDATKVKFQFNQVKATKARFTKKALLRLKDGKSVLGKLISSGSGKPFSSSIKELNLVAVSGFGLKLKDSKLDLSTITLSHVDDTELKELTAAIKKELSVDPLPKHLQFVIPDLPDKGFQSHLIGKISNLIVSLYPGSNYNSVDIYRALIDELNLKGQVTCDFTDWNDVLKNKALTSVTVTKVINQYTELKNEAKIQAEYAAIAHELNLKVMAGKSLKQSFERYRQIRVGNKSVAQLDVSAKINSAIRSHLSASSGDINTLIDLVMTFLDEKTKKNFASDQELRAAIICEYIMEDS